jgi:predicted DNA-binding transcriptional regulator YafY
MPANKYALIRYRTIDRCLTNDGRPFPSKEDLRSSCEEALYGSDGDRISISTIEKDLNAMRNDGGLGYYAPIVYHRDERGYYYEEKGYSIENLTLNDEELEAIRFAARTLVQYRNVPIFSQFDQAIGKIDDRLRLAPNMDTNALESIVQFEDAPATRGSENLPPLLAGIRKKRRLWIAHQKFQSKEAIDYLIEPYLLREYRNRWYLIAWSDEKGQYRTFGLDRIAEVRITDESFMPRTDFDADEFFIHSFGISKIADHPRDVRIRCNKLQYEYLLSQPVHSSQSLHPIKTDIYELRLHVLLTFELVQFLLGLGPVVEVVEPAELRKMMHDSLKESLKLYS